MLTAAHISPASQLRNDTADGSPTPSHFVEHDQALGLIELLAGGNYVQKQLFELKGILKKYQEQPMLLDPHLQSLLNPIVQSIRSNILRKNLTQLDQGWWEVLYLACNLRGYKVIVRFFTHEVSDLEPLLLFVVQSAATASWEARYIILLWLSLLFKIPFDLESLNTGLVQKETNMEGETLATTIIEILKPYLGSSAKERDSAGFALGHLLARLDIKAQEAYRDWAIQQLEEQGQISVNFRAGILGSICHWFATGNRTELIRHTEVLIPTFVGYHQQSSGTADKYLAKLVQRMGLTLLKPQPGRWLYGGQQNSLRDGKLKAEASGQNEQYHDLDMGEQEGVEIPDHLEDILDLLLRLLLHKDSSVRYSAAKGLARVSMRLPTRLRSQVFAEILGSLENVFTNRSEQTWHGIFLAVAEFVRRGLAGPGELGQALEWVYKGLLFDRRYGSHLLGVKVRDAGCYVLWSMARAYSSRILKPHLHRICSELLKIAVYDRDINVRRAACAAFQEFAGRQTGVPHGIDVIQMANFYTVGNMHDSYLRISLDIAQFDEYRSDLIKHLYEFRLHHWDASIKTLAGQTLGKFTVLEPEYMASRVLPELVAMMDVADAAGEVAKTWSHSRAAYNDDLWKSVLRQPLSIPLVKSLCESNFDWPLDCPDRLLSFLVASMDRLAIPAVPEPAIEDTGLRDIIGSLFSFWKRFPPELDLLRVLGVADSQQPGAQVRRAQTGWIMLAGLNVEAMGRFLPRLVRSLSTLIKLQKTTTGLECAGIKRDALCSLNILLDRISSSGTPISEVLQDSDVELTHGVLATGLHDTTLDTRHGDVGSWVRQQSIKMLGKLIVLNRAVAIKPDQSVLPGLLIQCIDRLDRTRNLAIEVTLQWIRGENPAYGEIPGLAARDEDEEGSYPAKASEDIPLLKQSPFHAILRVALVNEAFRESVVLAFLLDMGGFTKSLAQEASSALFETMKNDSQQVPVIASALSSLLAKRQRVIDIAPILQALNVIYDDGTLSEYDDLNNAAAMFALRTLSSTKGPNDRREKAVDLLCKTAPKVRSAYRRALGLLSSPEPSIRARVAEGLFATLCTSEDPDELQACNILLEVRWEESPSADKQRELEHLMIK